MRITGLHNVASLRLTVGSENGVPIVADVTVRLAQGDVPVGALSLAITFHGDRWSGRGAGTLDGVTLTPEGQKLAEICDRWHLNDLRAGCEHQRALGWTPAAYGTPEYVNRTDCVGKPCPTCGYRYGSAWLYEEVPSYVWDDLRRLGLALPTRSAVAAQQDRVTRKEA